MFGMRFVLCLPMSEISAGNMRLEWEIPSVMTNKYYSKRYCTGKHYMCHKHNVS